MNMSEAIGAVHDAAVHIKGGSYAALSWKRLNDAAMELGRYFGKLADAESEIERLQDALVSQEVHIVDGFLVITYPADGDILATCPSLHATVQEATQEEALAAVRDAMELAWSALISGRTAVASEVDEVAPSDKEWRCESCGHREPYHGGLVVSGDVQCGLSGCDGVMRVVAQGAVDEEPGSVVLSGEEAERLRGACIDAGGMCLALDDKDGMMRWGELQKLLFPRDDAPAIDPEDVSGLRAADGP